WLSPCLSRRTTCHILNGGGEYIPWTRLGRRRHIPDAHRNWRRSQHSRHDGWVAVLGNGQDPRTPELHVGIRRRANHTPAGAGIWIWCNRRGGRLRACAHHSLASLASLGGSRDGTENRLSHREQLPDCGSCRCMPRTYSAPFSLY